MADFELERRLRNPGGTRGGMGEFLVGLAMLIGGGYLFLDNVVVTSSSGWGGGWGGGWLAGNRPFGVILLPLFAGIGFLFFDGRSKLGWLLTVGSAIAIFVGIVASLTMQWRPTPLYYTIIMIGLIAGGLGLIARGLRSH